MSSNECAGRPTLSSVSPLAPQPHADGELGAAFEIDNDGHLALLPADLSGDLEVCETADFRNGLL